MDAVELVFKTLQTSEEPLNAGKIVEVGDINDVINDPIHPYTRGLVSSVPDLERKEVMGIAGLPPNLINPPLGCRFHPRCSLAKKECKCEEPAMYEVERGRLVACHLVAAS